jgi:hypothetical protein
MENETPGRNLARLRFEWKRLRQPMNHRGTRTFGRRTGVVKLLIHIKTGAFVICHLSFVIHVDPMTNDK